MFIKRLAISAFFFLFSTTALAEPFSVTWTDTLGAPIEPPYIAGQTVTVTIVLDNGSSDAISQTWTESDIVSVTYLLNNGAIETVFSGSPQLNAGGGSFVTDGSGALSAVPSAWGSFTLDAPVVTSNDPQGGSAIRWIINGGNWIYRNFSSGIAPPPAINAPRASAVNVASNITVAGWSDPVPVNPVTPPGPGPAPAATAIPSMPVYGLLLTALGLLISAGWQFRRSTNSRG
ncbi:PEP-CTERM sorting domain-containing protein [Pseudohalioglobus sediminis]|uniref:PEP-CTERM sorting domain-containing protein n=1 Tax=Pseudohalioglobus sediminis TaxID=2606449 RepID=A0A5B0WSE9_9GAMM|nr:PEP-CTERM sorting domain-containing protein [Pseudohalioglobus sediminis]KAA1189944.1 PEP-CTERM sorting domain-containing protein [Pseudohalioglobus sediminis]